MARPNFYARKHTVSAYRSGLEVKISEQLEKAGVNAEYEAYKIPYVKPQTNHKYCVDFVLPNGILIESKGLFDVADRQKHLLLKEQHPELDLRFVFSRSATKLYKGSKTTYADWCIKNGFKFADKLIPTEWLKEKTNVKSKAALLELTGDKHNG